MQGFLTTRTINPSEKFVFMGNKEKIPVEAVRTYRIILDICGLFDVNSFNKEKYFITFIDDFSRYGHVYLLHEKSESVDALEVYINEVERQLDKKVKNVRSDKGCEYYGRYDKVDNTLVSSLSSLRNVVFMLNTQFQTHHNKMVYHKGVIEP